MHRIAVVTAVLALALATSTARASEPAYSAGYTACLDASGGVTIAMIECMGSEFEAQDRRLNDVYRKALAALPAQRRAALTRAQRAWVAFKEADCDFLFDPDGGSAARIIANECAVRMTATRADELQAIVDDAGMR